VASHALRILPNQQPTTHNSQPTTNNQQLTIKVLAKGAGQGSVPESEAVGADWESGRVLELVEQVAAIRESRLGSLALVAEGTESLRGSPQRVEAEIPQQAEGQ
jgi:hypothetical protein